MFFQTEGQAFLRLRTGALGTLDTEKVSYIASLFLAELAVVLMLKDSILLMMCHISPQGFPTCTEKLTVVWALADDTKGGKWFAMFPPTPRTIKSSKMCASQQMEQEPPLSFVFRRCPGYSTSLGGLPSATG